MLRSPGEAAHRLPRLFSEAASRPSRFGLARERAGLRPSRTARRRPRGGPQRLRAAARPQRRRAGRRARRPKRPDFSSSGSPVCACGAPIEQVSQWRHVVACEPMQRDASPKSWPDRCANSPCRSARRRRPARKPPRRRVRRRRRAPPLRQRVPCLAPAAVTPSVSAARRDRQSETIRDGGPPRSRRRKGPHPATRPPSWTIGRVE